jgi:hypothetical protein
MEPVTISAQNLAKFQGLEDRIDAAVETMNQAVSTLIDIRAKVYAESREHFENVLKEHGVPEADFTLEWSVDKDTGILSIVEQEPEAPEEQKWVDPKDYPTEHGENPEVESLINDTRKTELLDNDEPPEEPVAA